MDFLVTKKQLNWIQFLIIVTRVRTECDVIINEERGKGRETNLHHFKIICHRSVSSFKIVSRRPPSMMLPPLLRLSCEIMKKNKSLNSLFFVIFHILSGLDWILLYIYEEIITATFNKMKLL